MPPKCPLCGKPLEAVRQGPNSMLNSDQFDASKAGDWFCECSNNGRGGSPYAYFWDSEVLSAQGGTLDAIEIRKLREHIHDMRARYENLQWDAKVALTKAESIQAEYLRLESLVDKLDKPQA